MSKQRESDGRRKSTQKEPAEVKPARGGRQRLRGPMDEQWLERNIRDIYQEVVKEPIPEDMLKILSRVGQGSKPKDE